MNGLNLLPWRHKRHARRAKIFTLQAVFALAVVIGLYFGLLSMNDRAVAALNVLQAQRQQIQTQTAALQTEIARLRQQTKDMADGQTVPSAQRQTLLTLLPDLPFEQGELQQAVFTAGHLRLTGYAADQMEFERLHGFLTARFGQPKLTEFKPEQQLYFQFDIDLPAAQ